MADSGPASSVGLPVGGRARRTAEAILAVAAVVGWPVAMAAALHWAGPRGAGALCAAAGLGVLLGAARRRAYRDGCIGGGLVLVGACSALLSAGALPLMTPVVVSGVLLYSFASSLRTELPLVERFARMQVSDLSDAERAHCRTVTTVWCWFFVANISATLALAVFGPLWLWTLHVGVLAYGAMGALFAVEYVVRKARFGRFGGAPWDRALQPVLDRVLPRHRLARGPR